MSSLSGRWGLSQVHVIGFLIYYVAHGGRYADAFYPVATGA